MDIDQSFMGLSCRRATVTTVLPNRVDAMATLGDSRDTRQPRWTKEGAAK